MNIFGLFSGVVGSLVLTVGWSSFGAGPLGPMENETDVGSPARRGKAEFNEGTQALEISGGGANMWFTNDAFHFVWTRLSGDFDFAADLAWVNAGGNAHRKACLVVRQDLTPGSAYVDVAVHGDGLTSLQFREAHDGMTREVQTLAKQPGRVGLERRGNVFSARTGAVGAEPEVTGAFMRLEFKDPVYVGFGVCAHDDQAIETARFSKIKLTRGSEPATTNRLHSTLETISISSKDRKVVYHAAEHFEAPNWAPDGSHLLFNSQGRIYRIAPAGGTPQVLETGSCIRCNNDHGLSADGTRLAISDQSASGKSLIYTLPAGGGKPTQVTSNGPSYWHGWSPDGKTLAYCAERNGEFDVYTIPADGGEERRITTAKGLDDGPEYSPDGQWIYFNSDRTGQMHIWRMHVDGSGQEQVTDDEFNNWFAHPSPDGKWMVFLSYEKEVTGHPANKNVRLRLMPMGAPTAELRGQIQELAHLFGGQGTINVPSWSPDSKQVAFVSYELLPAAK